MCFSVSVSKINPQPVSRRRWLQNELLELHPIAKVCLQLVPRSPVKDLGPSFPNFAISFILFLYPSISTYYEHFDQNKSKVSSLCRDILGVESCSQHRQDLYFSILHAQYLTLINFCLKLQFCARASLLTLSLFPIFRRKNRRINQPEFTKE